MSRFTLAPYKAIDALRLFDSELRDGESLDLSKRAAMERLAQIREESGAAYTLFCGDEIIGCGGIDVDGFRGNAWLLLSSLVMKYPKTATRVVKLMVKRIIKEFMLSDLFAEAEIDDDKAQRYLMILGFREENRVIKGLDDRQYLVYRRAV